MRQDAAPGLPRVLVFGGNGFVGSRVCEEALKTGLEVVSINRSGAPRHRAPWMDQVSWVQVRLQTFCMSRQAQWAESRTRTGILGAGAAADLLHE